MSRAYFSARGVALAMVIWCAACSDGASDSSSKASGGAGATNSGGGPSASTGGSGPASAEVEAYFAEFTELLCVGLGACCPAEGFEFSEDACRGIFDGIGAAFADLQYDAAAGERCLARLRSQSEDCSSNEDPFCDGVFIGNAELGEACRQTADCAPAAGGEVHCGIFGPELEQRCVLKVRANAGEPCTETCFEGEGVTTCSYATPASADDGPERRQCYLTDELRCDSDTLTCIPPAAQGEECVHGEDCGAYAACRDGVCADAAGTGEECFDHSECARGLSCDEMRVCSPAAGASIEQACTMFSGG